MDGETQTSFEMAFCELARDHQILKNRVAILERALQMHVNTLDTAHKL